MPAYEYRCKTCGRTFEIEHGFHDERPSKCDECGGQLVRVFHPVGVVFKGSGFHKTDYARSTSRKEEATASKSDTAKTDGSKKAASATSEAKSTSEKPKSKDTKTE